MYSRLPRVQPGEGAGALLDVLLGVVADAHGEEFQELAAKVLVDGVLVVVLVVQPDDHGRIPGEFRQQVSEAAHAPVPEHADLVGEGLAVDDLGVSGGEDAVPEQGDLLPQRGGSAGHAVQPVLAGTQGAHHAGQLGVEPADEVVTHALLAAVVEEPLDGGLVALGGVGFQLLAGGAEAGAPHQVADEFDIAVCHILPPLN